MKRKCCCGDLCTCFIDTFSSPLSIASNTFFPDGNYYIHSGDWTVVDGELTIDDDDARLEITPNAPCNGPGIGSLDVDFYITFRGTDGDKIYLGDSFDFEYNYIVITIGTPGKIELFTNFLGGDHKFAECVMNITEDVNHTLRIKGGYFVYLDDMNAELIRMIDGNLVPRVLGTETIDTTVYFDNLTYKILYPDITSSDYGSESFAAFTDCEVGCGDCPPFYSDGIKVPVTVEIADATTWDATMSGGIFRGLWDFSPMNGTYELDEPDGDCGWKLTGLHITVRPEQPDPADPMNPPLPEIWVTEINFNIGYGFTSGFLTSVVLNDNLGIAPFDYLYDDFTTYPCVGGYLESDVSGGAPYVGYMTVQRP